MTAPRTEDVKRGIAVIWENLQCPICLDLMHMPVSTKCDHQFCKFCMLKLLDRSKRKEANCPVCKTKVTKRSLQESPGFQRLVEGLQNVVQSYEFDTCTNYLTGLPQKRQDCSVESDSRVEQSSGENTITKVDVIEKATSLSSSAAAKDAFAKLMDLEDLCTPSSEKHSAQSDPVPPSEQKSAGTKDVPPQKEAQKEDQHLEGQKSKKRSKKRSKRTGLEPDRIADKRQKKSVEKVSEWLLKIVTSSDTQSQGDDGDRPISIDGDSDEESTGSSASTEVNIHVDKPKVSPPRETPARRLEEQVFGAVYKRERRLTRTKLTRGISPEREIPVAAQPSNLEQEEEKTMSQVPKRNSRSRLTPADFVMKPENMEEPEESAPRNLEEENRQEEDSESKVNRPPKCLEGHDVLVDICSKENHNDNNKAESSAFEVPLKRPGRRSKSKMQNTWEDVDSDLKERENNRDNGKGAKRRPSRNNSDATKDGDLKECKSSKYAKTLDFVSAGEETVDLMKNLASKPKLLETEVNIESYPSPMELQSPTSRDTRRSLRLQAFTAEVQGTRKRKGSTRAPPKPADGSIGSRPKEDNLNADTASADANQDSGDLQNGKSEQLMKKNGCICNDDEKFQTIQTIEDEIAHPCVSEGHTPEDRSIVSVVPDTVDHDGLSNSCQVVVVGSQSPLLAVAPESVLQEKRQESPSTAADAPQVSQTAEEDAALMAAGQRGYAEEECDANDSELDTALLLNTFKGTKRKSFYLGSPGTKSQNEALNVTSDKNKQQQTQNVICLDGDCNSDLTNICPNELSPSNPCEPKAKSSQSGQSSLANAGEASVSLLQVKLSSWENQEDTFPKNSGTSESPALSPNRVGKSSQDSRLLGNSGTCQLFLDSPTKGDPQILSSRSRKKEQSGKSPSSTTDISKENQKNDSQENTKLDIKIPDIPLGSMPNSGIHNNMESSITPDGLLAGTACPPVHQDLEPAVSQGLRETQENDVELLSQPCVRRKRRAQRLESSESELSAEDDDLPSMAQIFRSHRSTSSSRIGPPPKSDSSLNQDGLKFGSESQHGQAVNQFETVPHSHRGLNDGSPQKENPQEHSTKAELTPAVQDNVLPPPESRDVWITSSQGSGDLFGTPEECEAVDVVCSNVGPSRDSSQYSSEILNTQQKTEMQQELQRLERMMALVSEALQRKESDSEVKVGTEDHGHAPTEAPDSTPCDLHQAGADPSVLQADRKAVPDSGGHRACLPNDPSDPEGPEHTQLLAPLTRGLPKPKAGRRTSRRSQKSSKEGSRKQLEAHLGVTGCGVNLEALNPEPAKAQKQREGEREATAEGKRTSTTEGTVELVASGLSALELRTVKKFARKMQGSLYSQVTPTTTHIIIKTDAELVCERTLKYFQGIACRKWVVSFLWISESFKQGKVLDAAQFEVRGDAVNGPDHNGPHKARTAQGNKLLLTGYEICFQGSFTDMTTAQMEAMVGMCGATVVKDPQMFSKQSNRQLVVVQPGSDESQSHYRALRKSVTVVTRSWLLDSIATYTLQNPENYKP